MSSTPKTEPVSHANTPASAAAPGEMVLDRYRLKRRLGAGGMGVVYLAVDEHLEREVAVKRIAIEHDLDGRGEREALAAARLSHPGIVALYEAGRDDEAVYLVSELVHGETLAALLYDGALSDRDVLMIGVTLCAALEHAHARGVIHRDVKPSNVLCPEDPEQAGGVVAKLADFGIARMADHDVLTRTGDIIGTLAYMAPEQARGQRLSGAADVYALGIVLYEGLSGTNPIRAGNPAATARRVGMRLPPLGRMRRDLPAGVCRAIDAAVDPEVGERIGLASLRTALTGAIDEVSDEPGCVTGAPLEALTELTRRLHAERRPGRRPRRRALQAPDPEPERLQHPGAVEPERRPRRLALPRLLAGAAAAALAGAALAWLPEPPLGPAVGAAVAGPAVLLLPRLGWLLTTAALLVWLAIAAPGIALLALAAALPVPLLLARSGPTWSLPAIAPLLGLAGLALAWPALAGQAARWHVRAALGALGGWWLALAEALTSERLLSGPARDVEARAAWEAAPLDGARDALWPLLSGGGVAFAALWGLAAALLPVLVRGRSAALDLVGVAGWAAGLAAATQALAQALALDPPRGLVLGALAAAVIAVAVRATRART